MWVLKTDEDAPDSVTFRIRPGSIKTIGRSSGAEFMVDAALVSRLHCRLTAGAAELQVDDLESTNGTFVNGKRIQRASLKEGDRLGIGRVELVVARAAE
jgi:ABC transport system ATP-binding/permease protein